MCWAGDFFNLSEGIPVQMSQLSAAAAGAEGAHLETGQTPKMKRNVKNGLEAVT